MPVPTKWTVQPKRSGQFMQVVFGRDPRPPVETRCQPARRRSSRAHMAAATAAVRELSIDAQNVERVTGFVESQARTVREIPSTERGRALGVSTTVTARGPRLLARLAQQSTVLAAIQANRTLDRDTGKNGHLCQANGQPHVGRRESSNLLDDLRLSFRPSTIAHWRDRGITSKARPVGDLAVAFVH